MPKNCIECEYGAFTPNLRNDISFYCEKAETVVIGNEAILALNGIKPAWCPFVRGNETNEKETVSIGHQSPFSGK